ncbi:hypothetical protein ABU614_05230 [Lysobacter firmicutimachus]|uniref:Microbial collagenase n=1 Tax=Lysobacter firmicutimachus TaxID=1792846 RepID=A0AAU8MSU1_9GAMM
MRAKSGSLALLLMAAGAVPAAATAAAVSNPRDDTCSRPENNVAKFWNDSNFAAKVAQMNFSGGIVCINSNVGMGAGQVSASDVYTADHLYWVADAIAGKARELPGLSGDADAFDSKLNELNSLVAFLRMGLVNQPIDRPISSQPSWLIEKIQAAMDVLVYSSGTPNRSIYAFNSDAPANFPTATNSELVRNIALLFADGADTLPYDAARKDYLITTTQAVIERLKYMNNYVSLFVPADAPGHRAHEYLNANAFMSRLPGYLMNVLRNSLFSTKLAHNAQPFTTEVRYPKRKTDSGALPGADDRVDVAFSGGTDKGYRQVLPARDWANFNMSNRAYDQSYLNPNVEVNAVAPHCDSVQFEVAYKPNYAPKTAGDAPAYFPLTLHVRGGYYDGKDKRQIDTNTSYGNALGGLPKQVYLQASDGRNGVYTYSATFKLDAGSGIDAVEYPLSMFDIQLLQGSPVYRNSDGSLAATDARGAYNQSEISVGKFKYQCRTTRGQVAADRIRNESAFRTAFFNTFGTAFDAARSAIVSENPYQAGGAQAALMRELMEGYGTYQFSSRYQASVQDTSVLDWWKGRIKSVTTAVSDQILAGKTRHKGMVMALSYVLSYTGLLGNCEQYSMCRPYRDRSGADDYYYDVKFTYSRGGYDWRIWAQKPSDLVAVSSDYIRERITKEMDLAHEYFYKKVLNNRWSESEKNGHSYRAGDFYVNANAYNWQTTFSPFVEGIIDFNEFHRDMTYAGGTSYGQFYDRSEAALDRGFWIYAYADNPSYRNGNYVPWELGHEAAHELDRKSLFLKHTGDTNVASYTGWPRDSITEGLAEVVQTYLSEELDRLGDSHYLTTKAAGRPISFLVHAAQGTVSAKSTSDIWLAGARYDDSAYCKNRGGCVYDINTSIYKYLIDKDPAQLDYINDLKRSGRYSAANDYYGGGLRDAYEAAFSQSMRSAKEQYVRENPGKLVE